jgi:hypothetical protein
MPSELEHLPPVEAVMDMEAARVTLRAVVGSMEPDGWLTDMWGDYTRMIESFTEGAGSLGHQILQQLRVGLETVEGDADCGEYLIASAKMCLSAYLLVAPNPYYAFYPEKDIIHDDVQPLVLKGLRLAYLARDSEPFDLTIRIDQSRPEKLEKAHEQNFIRGLLGNALWRADGE